MTRASDLAKLLGAGATINDGTTITTADNDPQLILTSTDADANRGPELHFVRDSSSPADNDLCGTIKAFGKNSAGEDVQLGEIIFRNEDVTDGTEDGQIILNMMRNGTSAQVMKLSSTETVLNGDSVDLDFRVESNGNANMLFVDGGNDRVGIGIAPSTTFDVLRNGGGAQTVANFAAHNYGDTASTYIQLGTEYGDGSSRIGSVNTVSAGGNTSAITFETHQTSAGSWSEVLRIRYHGRICAYNCSNELGNLNVVGEVGVGYRAISFARTTNGSEVGSIVANTSSTSYNTSSDYRLKENLVTDWDATTRLKQLNPVRFNFIADANTTVDGFLAHEVSSIIPEAISGDKDEVDEDGNPVYQGIDQSKLVPLLVKTIQELEARITALEGA